MARPRRNNADYFPHDNGMRKDGRITVLRSKFGLDGYAIYRMTLELLTEANDFEIIIDEVELQIIAADFGISPDRLNEIWNEADHLRLFEFSGNRIYCPKLADRLQPLLVERERQRDKAQKRWKNDGETIPRESFTVVKPRKNDAGAMQSKEEYIKEEGNKLPNHLPQKNNPEKLDLSGIDPGYIAIVEDWLKYKSSKKQSYKNQQSINTFVNALKKFSKNNPEIARDIVDLSIANNYSGIYEPKNLDKNEFKQLIQRRGGNLATADQHAQDTV
jgi:hypothetical protein